MHAQFSDHLYVDNRDSALIRRLGIIECQSFTTKFDNEIPKGKQLYRIERFNEKGLLTSSVDYSTESDTLDFMLIKYDSLNRLGTVQWYALSEGLIKETAMTVYNYDRHGQMIKECEFKKINSQYILDSCHYFHYANGKLSAIKNVNNDTLIYYQYKENRAYRFDKSHKIVSCYRNGFQEYLIHGYTRFIYNRENINGNIISVVIFDTKTNTFNKTLVDYKNGIPVKSVEFDEFGNTMTVQEHIYKKQR